jgi:STE24 endopeptidase
MSEMTATRMRSRHSLLLGAVLLAAVVVWGVAIVLLWRTEIPSDLRLPALDRRDYFTAADLARTADYERFYYVTWALSLVATLVTLAVLARRAPAWASGLGLGRVGTAVVIGMLTLTTLWFVGLPFGLANRWWQQRHGLTHGSWIDWLTDPWLQLIGEAVVALVLIVVLLLLAGRFPRGWWLPAVPVLAALSVVVAIGYGGLIALDSHPVRNPRLRQDARVLARVEGAQGTPVEVEDVHDLTTQANAMAVGLGPTERVVLWDTLLDGRFSGQEVRFILAHELGHIVRGHLWKGLIWFVLFAMPVLALLAWITGRRGGMRDPGVLPYGILVLVLIELGVTPLANIVSRRYESEADWMALRTTRNPTAGQGVFEEFSKTSLARPDPPTWAYVLFETHPTLMQRIAMAEAWKERNRQAGG